MTAIEWTDVTWNPTTGCDRVSPGCDHCYALTLAKRLKGMGSAKYQTDGDPRTSGPGFLATEHADSLDAPLGWRKPRKVFVNSMSDLFHDNISAEFIARVFAVMAATPRHTYQILTKRHARMRSLLRDDGQILLEHLHREGEAAALYDAVWPLPNVWLGVSVESQQWADIRIPALLGTPAAVRWLSCEPLLGPVDLAPWLLAPLCAACLAADPERPMCDSCYVDFEAKGFGERTVRWVVVGGESGRGSRPMRPEWAQSLRDQCTATGVPFLFTQWGGRTPKSGGRELDGRTWDEYPAVQS